MKVYGIIQSIIEKEIPQLAGSFFDFSHTPENQPGDIGLACFRFTKTLMDKPDMIASRIAAIKYLAIVEKSESIGAYVNFTLNRQLFASELISEILEKSKQFGANKSGDGRKVLLEHTSINPNASPHIGRARNGLLGDVFARLFRFMGYDVNVHYYVNDMGKQIGLLALQTKNKATFSFEDVLDDYVKANQRAKEDPEFEAAGLDLLMKMEQDDPTVRNMFKKIVDICLGGQLKVLGRLGLTYDTFDRESAFLKDKRMDEVFSLLRERGALFTDNENRTVADLSKLGYNREEGRYIVLLRANGSSMYMYRDIAYTLEKIERAEDYNYIVLGEDHKMYFEQLSLIIEALGKKPPVPVHYSYILLREGKMSTRQGNVVLLSDFLDEAIRLARERVDEQWGDLPEEDRGEIARKIGIGAVKFTILSVKPSKNVVFDWDTALSFNGDSGPYIQYSCTRISSILRKYGKEISIGSDELVITHDSEWRLLMQIANTEDDVSVALNTKNPAIIANSALEIARKFSAFYNECPVLGTADEKVRETRISICISVKKVLENLLNLLGIEAPERM